MWISRDRYEALERRVQQLEDLLAQRPDPSGFQPGAQAWPTLPEAHLAVPDGAVPVEDPELRALLRQGKTIPAIKRYRELTGAGLAEAKDAVEAIQRMA